MLEGKPLEKNKPQTLELGGDRMKGEK